MLSETKEMLLGKKIFWNNRYTSGIKNIMDEFVLELLIQML